MQISVSSVLGPSPAIRPRTATPMRRRRASRELYRNKSLPDDAICDRCKALLRVACRRESVQRRRSVSAGSRAQRIPFRSHDPLSTSRMAPPLLSSVKSVYRKSRVQAPPRIRTRSSDGTPESVSSVYSATFPAMSCRPSRLWPAGLLPTAHVDRCPQPADLRSLRFAARRYSAV